MRKFVWVYLFPTHVRQLSLRFLGYHRLHSADVPVRGKFNLFVLRVKNTMYTKRCVVPPSPLVHFLDTKKRYVQNLVDSVKSYFNGNVFYFSHPPFFFISFCFLEFEHFVFYRNIVVGICCTFSWYLQQEQANIT